MAKTFEFDKWRDKKVLEIGAGVGIDAIEYAKYGAKVYATDMTDTAVAFIADNFMDAGVEAKEIRKADANQLPYEDNFFDLVYCFGVIHHNPEPKEIIREIHRVLKPNGKVYMMLYHKDSLLYYFSIIYLRGIVKGGFSEGLTEEQLLSRYSEGKEGMPLYKSIYGRGCRKPFKILNNMECISIFRYKYLH